MRFPSFAANAFLIVAALVVTSYLFGLRSRLSDYSVADTEFPENSTSTPGTIDLPPLTPANEQEMITPTFTPTAEPVATQVPTNPPNTPIPVLYAIVNVPHLNLRSAPSTADSNNIVGTLANGKVLTILGTSPDENWLNVQTDDGLQGWVAANLVTIVNEK